MCFQSVFDVYCLEEARPGSVHTGYYWMSYEFVYVGNHHVRNILLLASIVSLIASIPLFITSCFLLNAMRLENQTGFVAWMITMTVFSIWKMIHLGYTTVVNDMIFGYNLFTFFTWIIFNALNIGSLVLVYSFYQELRSLDQIETMTQQKLDLSSRAGSVYGSRAGSLYGSKAGSIYGSRLDTINREYFGSEQQQSGEAQANLPPFFTELSPGPGATGIYAASPASVYSSTPREHIYHSLQRPDTEQIYSTVIH